MQCNMKRCIRKAAGEHGLCAYHSHVLRPHLTLVDAGPSTVWVRHLLGLGWTLTDIARQSGLSWEILTGLRDGTATQCREQTEIALLSIGSASTCDEWVPAWPTTRRLQSLHAAGYGTEQLANVCGIAPDVVLSLTLGEREEVSAQAAEIVDAWWQVLAPREVSEPTDLAVKHNWPVPMAWRDIDDRDDCPGGGYCRRCGAEQVTAMGMCEACYTRDYRARRKLREVAQ